MAFSECPKAKSVSASEGLCPLSPCPGALPLDPTGGLTLVFVGGSTSLAPALGAGTYKKFELMLTKHAKAYSSCSSVV